MRRAPAPARFSRALSDDRFSGQRKCRQGACRCHQGAASCARTDSGIHSDPGSIGSAMFYTGLDFDCKPVKVVKTSLKGSKAAAEFRAGRPQAPTATISASRKRGHMKKLMTSLMKSIMRNDRRTNRSDEPAAGFARPSLSARNSLRR